MKHLRSDQVVTLLATARANSERDFLMILTTYLHGLRASETTTLRTTDFQGGFVTVKRLKGSATTVQPLFSNDNPLLDEHTALTAYLKTVPQGARVFPMTRQHFYVLFSQYVLAAGLPAHLKNPHVLKHSAAMSLIRNQVPLNSLQAFLGHRSLSSTQQYLKVDQQVACDDAAAAFGRIGAQ